MKRSLLLVGFILLCLTNVVKLQAQALQEIDMSVGNNHFDNYVTGINNRGLVSGYYNFAGTYHGYVITAHGKRLLIDIPGFTDTKAQAVNNNAVVLVSASNGAGNITPYRVYVDTTGDSISSKVAVTTMQQPSGVPYKMNDNNDIVGWYQGASDRWLWIDRDSLGGWDAQRYYTGNWPSYTYYNTYGQGINNARMVGGYYIDGGLLTPFLYDGVTQNFTVITNAPSKTKIWAINNNGVVAGEYLQANGFYMGFWGTVSGTSLTYYSLNTIFANATIQSVVNGINDNGDMVGQYLHPVNGNWVGFIYRPTTAEFRMPGFNFATNTWRMVNSEVGSNTVWPSSYWSGFSYGTQDPYANNGNPMLDNYLKTAYGINQLPSKVCPDWISFCQELDSNNVGTDPTKVDQYNTIFKYKFFSDFAQEATLGMSGLCYGFSYSTLYRYFYDNLYSSWFGMPANSNLPQITNANSAAVRSITRCYIKQMDKYVKRKWSYSHQAEEDLGAGLFRLKTTYLRPYAETNPSSIAIQLNNGYHNLLPYKIHTPQTLPFDYPTSKYDTIFIFDSNYPNASDSIRHFTIKANQWFAAYDSAWNTDYPNMVDIDLNKPGIRDVSTKHYTHYNKHTAGPADDIELDFALNSNPYYNISSTNTQASYNASGFSNNNITDFTPVFGEVQGAVAPVNFTMDTTLSVSYNTYNYIDSVMRWSQNNTSRTMGLTRHALPGEHDNGSLKNRLIAYGNPENVSKSLTGYLTEMAPDLSQAVSLEADGICAEQGDSIVTENPVPYVYKITRVNGNGTCSYHVVVYTVDNDTVKQWEQNGVPFDPNSSHTIDAYYPGPNGPTVVIIVDQGNNNTPDDTIQVTQVPLNFNSPVHYAPFVKVYPNPASKFVNIDITAGIMGSYHVSITDITGKIVYQNTLPGDAATSLQVPLTSLSTGTYLLLVTTDNGQVLYRDKLIKD